MPSLVFYAFNMTESPKRRLGDHTEEGMTWSTATENKGIRNRLLFAMPGAEVALREGTNEAYFDKKGTTWGKVMRILCEAGILEEDSTTGRLVKKVVAFGGKRWKQETVPQEDLFDVIEEAHRNELDALDPETLEGRKSAVAIILRENLMESFLEHGTHNYTPFLDELVEAALNTLNQYSIGDLEALEGESFWGVDKVLSEALHAVWEKHCEVEDVDDALKRHEVTYEGQQKLLFVYRMMNKWSVQTLSELRSLCRRRGWASNE